MTAKYVGGWISVGEGRDAWAFPDPNKTTGGTAEALRYLIHVCPTTKEATAKLAAMRRAVRSLKTGTPGGER